MIGKKNSDESERKKTKTLLLKSAKLNTEKPGPFALLGIWYETQQDGIRAKGCYQKALALDLSHPIAGRGLQRLVSMDEALHVCESGAKQNSSVNGWAWRALAQHKSREEGDDTTAIICLQQALRCRDIQMSGNDTLGAFYANPTSPDTALYCEASETWAELAVCYRQLGKHTASLRAYEMAHSVSNGNLSPGILCSWAQVDLDLGLYEDAADLCSKVLSAENSTDIGHMAAYIEGEALLFLARDCMNEGKFGLSLHYLESAIKRISSLSIEEKSKSAKNHFCEVKLLGDLYSSGCSLPPYVFAASDDQSSEKANEVSNQLSFLQKGEKAYTLNLVGSEENEDEEDNIYLIAAAATDLGTNLLSQARIVSMALGDGSGGGTNTSSSDLVRQSSQLKDLITRSINAYMRAIDSCPHEAGSWCGLGCALIAIDPVMSQHAFSRALQIDPSLSDSWSNVGLLYTNHDTEKCSEILDYLTQVDDTPLMWIGRGFLLEKTSRAWTDLQDLSKEACLTKAADAYRAALQIMQHPAALLGLSLTCRRADNRLKESNELVYSELAENTSKLESRVSINIHQVLTGGDNVGASYVSGLTEIEEGLNRLKVCGGTNESATLLIQDAEQAFGANSRNVTSSIPDQGKIQSAQCEMDLSVTMSVIREEEKEDFSINVIKSATIQALSVSTNKSVSVGPNTYNDSLNEARNNVHLNPESGEAWLIFANLLARETCPSKNLPSAKAAAQRAYELLQDRVVNATLLIPRKQVSSQGKSVEYSDTSVVSSLPSASLFSQSIALLSKLKEAEDASISDRTLVSLQESLLLDPTNSFAAASLSY